MFFYILSIDTPTDRMSRQLALRMLSSHCPVRELAIEFAHAHDCLDRFAGGPSGFPLGFVFGGGGALPFDGAFTCGGFTAGGALSSRAGLKSFSSTPRLNGHAVAGDHYALWARRELHVTLL